MVTGVLNSQEIVIFGANENKVLIFNSKTDCIKETRELDFDMDIHYRFPSQSAMVTNNTIVAYCHDRTWGGRK